LRAITLTNAYSSKPAKTKTRHADIHTSIALIYDTRGSCDRIPKYQTFIRSYLRIPMEKKALSKAIGIMRIRLLPELCVVTVRTVKSPTEILAGT